jgi:hypothetical protein
MPCLDPLISLVAGPTGSWNATLAQRPPANALIDVRDERCGVSFGVDVRAFAFLRSTLRCRIYKTKSTTWLSWYEPIAVRVPRARP